MDLFRKDLFFFLAHLSLTLNSKKPLYSYCSCYCIVIIFVLTCRYIVLYKWIYILRFSPPIRSKCTYFLYSYVVLHTRTYILRAYSTPACTCRWKSLLSQTIFTRTEKYVSHIVKLSCETYFLLW